MRADKVNQKFYHTVFLKLIQFQYSGHQNKMICSLVGQGAAELLKVKVGSLKKDKRMWWPRSNSTYEKEVEQRFFGSPNTFAAPWPSRFHSTSFKSSKQGLIGFCFKKSVKALLGVSLVGQNTPSQSTFKPLHKLQIVCKRRAMVASLTFLPLQSTYLIFYV